MINTTTLNKSIGIAQRVLDISDNLKGVGAEVDYYDRNEFFTNLLGADGHLTFHPEVTSNIIEPFREILLADRVAISRRYDRSNPRSDEERISRFELYVSNKLYELLSAEDLINNVVPVGVLDYIKELGDPRHNDELEVKLAKGLQSPKLSKLLVKLFGEQSDTVKWFTTKCPKDLDKGVLSDWNVTLSVLPHHIAGMSYYAPLNHGGDRWKEGYEGTSCMDTDKNGKGSGVFQLIPSLRDTTMAVAYLSKSTDSDIWNPIYDARCLVRVVNVNGNQFMIACRTYFTSNETSHILIEGLKNQFGNVHYVQDMRGFKSGTEWVNVEVSFPDEGITFEVDKDITCTRCDGRGRIEDEDGDSCRCNRCSGDGRWHVEGSYLPYIDDQDFLHVSDMRMKFKLPVSYFESKGISIQEEVEEALLEEVVKVDEEVAVVGEAHQMAYARFFTDDGEVELPVQNVEVDFGAMEEQVMAVGNHIVQGIQADRMGMGMGYGALMRGHEAHLQVENAQFNVEELRRLLGINRDAVGDFETIYPVGFHGYPRVIRDGVEA